MFTQQTLNITNTVITQINLLWEFIGVGIICTASSLIDEDILRRLQVRLGCLFVFIEYKCDSYLLHNFSTTVALPPGPCIAFLLCSLVCIYAHTHVHIHLAAPQLV